MQISYRCQSHQQFTNSFLDESVFIFHSFPVLSVRIFIFWPKESGKKAASEMLVKLTKDLKQQRLQINHVIL